MTHTAAHAAKTANTPGTIHGVVTAHLTDATKGAAARTAVGNVPRVTSVTVLDGAIVALVELPAPPHASIPPTDTAAHTRLKAVADQIALLPPGATSYFDWVTHT
jgi:hypothetical protein